MRLIPLALALTITLGLAHRSQAQQAVYLIRHAEKLADGSDGLSDTGKKRAEALARLLKDAKVEAIYTSEFKRTQQTAAPLAALLGLTPVVVAAAKPAKTVEKIRADHPKGVVLVVGHSNTVPAMIGLWDAGLVVAIDDATEFDRLFVLAPKGPGKASLGRLRYRASD